MQLTKSLIPFFLIFFLAGCSEHTPSIKQNVSEELKPDNVCDTISLRETSAAFVNSLRSGNAFDVASYYQNQDEALVDYTFYPSLNQAAIFDFPIWSKGKPIYSHTLGKYENGHLVIFSLVKIDKYNANYFEENKKFKTFFVCNFVCHEDVWKISSTETCFEETGAPFEN